MSRSEIYIEPGTFDYDKRHLHCYSPARALPGTDFTPRTTRKGRDGRVDEDQTAAEIYIEDDPFCLWQ